SAADAVAGTRKGRHGGRPFRYLKRQRSELALDLLALEDLDHVALTDVVVVLERHAAFLAGLDLAHLVLEALERLQRAFVDHHVVAQQAHAGRAAGDALSDKTARDVADAGDAEDLPDLGVADEVLAH